MADHLRALRQALVLLLASGVVALAAAGVWSLLQDGGFRSKFAISLLVIAGLLALTSGTVLPRSGFLESRLVHGEVPEREGPAAGEGLTGLGVFAFVSVPLLVIGAVLLG
ncbi:hypothetical protein [Geodermatophilus marinus]|uniref:hypothetical protein n=1 Tax=Geodermatophilus sp. LHW52908 TaxID=2303986 RepID=UPI000E3C5A19|nr:hypothetical protein [Geodermatophilus sp. LHW52908]RFU21130.1 hypothetical protein D0Z06_12045 [Geodermatophilus sp. LHW52908]